MEDEAFSFMRSKRPMALLDLVESPASEAGHSFVALTRQCAEEQGGRVVLANKAVAPMILPDEGARKAEEALRLLVVSQYPSGSSAESAWSQREKGQAPDAGSARTFAVRPVGGVESLFGRTLSSTLGRWRREPIPRIDGSVSRSEVIEGALVLGEQPDRERWLNLCERAGDRPIWMLNFLEFEKEAVYREQSRASAPVEPASGAKAYRRYGKAMIRSLAAVGGRVGWSGYAVRQCAGKSDGHWDQVAIAVYPSPAAMMTMLALPRYRAAHIHRAAALKRTRLLATQPLEE
ncbi:MAG: hypothetical protein ACJZ7Z_05690 [Myxococcota bacterium]